MKKLLCFLIAISSFLLLSACSNNEVQSSEVIVEETLPTTYATEETSLPTEEAILSEYETRVIFWQMYNETEALLKEILNATLYWNEHDFATMAEIRQLETLWSNMEERAQNMVSIITENKPACEYEELWNDYKAIIVDLPPLFAMCTNLDPNQDGTYTTDEMLPLLREVKEKATEKLSESGHITMKVPLPYSAPSSTNENDEGEITQSTTTISGDTENGARHTDSEAWTCAKKIVKDNLKSPSSAKFCAISDATITHVGNGQYRVSGWVDAQNSFGAVIREYFTVTYTALPSGFKNASVNFS